MPRPRAVASLAANFESEMDEDTILPDALPTPESNQENAQPTGKGRGRGKASVNATTKAKLTQKRAGVEAAVGKKKAAAKKPSVKRGPLKEQSNNQNPEDTEEVDDFDEIGRTEGEAAASADELVAVKEPAKKAPAGMKRKNQPKKKQNDSETLQQIKGTANDGEFEYTPVTARQAKPTKKTSSRHPANQRVTAEVPISEKVIPDTQDVVMEDKPQDMPFLSDEEEEIPQSVFRRTNHAQSRQRPPTTVRKRVGSASDTERGVGDPAIRRKLGEMTKKLENLDMKYKTLKEVGIKEAEANFDKLKTSSEAKSKAANELIASLKKELATQKALAQESRTLQKQLVNKDIEVSKAQALATELSNTLSEVQNENKVLQAKVAGARSSSAAIESASSKTPGSTIKGKGPARTVMVGSAEAAQAAQTAQLKEDLYRDLTGLLVLGVERGSEADTYDCIQTGRNGTLHFKLSIATSSEDSYEDTEFQYTPRLDNDRDRDLLELLPDYLSEEITFSRLNAAKFYGRVVETLTKKRVENDEG
ncbi:MAG: hypothetical protein LQ343_002449 [Gyalolechia ehrenbergii]|nr:MAG: hypothetical protein LQ343_002449 [Gyalolechia ehrenbergii]